LKGKYNRCSSWVT